MTTFAACPFSPETTDHNTVRVTGVLTVATLAAFAVTGWIVVAAALAVDYTVRAWTGGASPMQRLGRRIARRLGIGELPKSKAPKQFAARVGWMFAVASVALCFVSPTAGVAVGLSLLGFNVLDSVFDFCVGCWMYSSIIVPVRARLAALPR